MVALSTCEAKYVATATAACQVVWLRRLLDELMVDNQPAIALVKNLVLHDRSKHIDVKFHFLRDCVDGGQIVRGRSSSSSSKLVDNSRTSSPSRSAVFDSQS